MRSLCLISIPFTRATTGSFGLAASGWLAEDEVFFEQPEAAGRMNSPSAAITANVVQRGRRAMNSGSETDRVLCEFISAVLEYGRSRRKSAGHSRNRPPFAMVQYRPILTIT